MALLYSYKPIQQSDTYFKAYRGPQGDLWNKMIDFYRDSDDTNDFYLKIRDNEYEKINPDNLTEKGNGEWATYKKNNGESILLSANNLFRVNPLTPTATGSAFRLNSNTPPAATPNNNAYSYKEWKSGNLADLQALSNIYGDIDTADEFKIIRNLGNDGIAALNYINNNYADASGSKKSLFNNNGDFIGTLDELKKAASLLNQYLTNEAAGKEFATQLLRGQATLPMLDRYKAYSEFNGDLRDRRYLNEALNSRDKMYRGHQFYRRYAGNKTWGTLANQFATNDRFIDDHYTVGAEHVKDRLNRDAGLGNGRKLIEIYNDIINKGNLTDEQAYDLFRDMTRRRFKMDNDFWNRHAAYLSGIRNKVVGTDEVIFKEGGQIFRMLFV